MPVMPYECPLLEDPRAVMLDALFMDSLAARQQSSAGTCHSPGSPVSFFVSSGNLPAAEAEPAAAAQTALRR